MEICLIQGTCPYHRMAAWRTERKSLKMIALGKFLKKNCWANFSISYQYDWSHWQKRQQRDVSTNSKSTWKSLFGGCHLGYGYYQLINNNVIIIIITLLQAIKRKMEKNSMPVLHPSPLMTKILRAKPQFSSNSCSWCPCDNSLTSVLQILMICCPQAYENQECLNGFQDLCHKNMLSC